jgi:hypothetical protein
LAPQTFKVPVWNLKDLDIAICDIKLEEPICDLQLIGVILAPILVLMSKELIALIFQFGRAKLRSQNATLELRTVGVFTHHPLVSYLCL